jgi:hypothetical protein
MSSRGGTKTEKLSGRGKAPRQGWEERRERRREEESLPGHKMF